MNGFQFDLLREKKESGLFKIGLEVVLLIVTIGLMVLTSMEFPYSVIGLILGGVTLFVVYRTSTIHFYAYILIFVGLCIIFLYNAFK